MRVKAHKILTASPSDVAELRHLIENGKIDPANVVCVIGKTEGNGGTNDFSRSLATTSLESLFAPYLGMKPCDVQVKIIISFSGGTEGVVSPHMIVFSREGEWRSEPSNAKRLVIGIAYTRAFEPSEIGRMAQIEETSRTFKKLAADLRLDSPNDIHLVQMIFVYV
jgi:cyanuric acid amidohydrolase